MYKLLHSHFENARRYKEIGRQFWYKQPTPHPKTPYASVLFEDTPEETRAVAERLRDAGYAVVKFGWGPMGPDLELDVALVREGAHNLPRCLRLRTPASYRCLLCC